MFNNYVDEMLLEKVELVRGRDLIAYDICTMHIGNIFCSKDFVNGVMENTMFN